ncbi:MAG: hypothetical protein RLZZ393_1138 [Pseudomonadota bacterium]
MGRARHFLFLMAIGLAPVPAALSVEPSGAIAILSAAAPELPDLVDQAVRTYPSVDAARASVRAAGADVKAARWQRFPSISVEGLLLDQSRRARQISASPQTQAVVDQPLWTAGRISGGIDRATARRDASLAAYDEAALNVALSTSQAYFELQRWVERTAVLSRSLAQHKDMVETMERRVASTVSPSSDLELARTRALQIEQQVLQSDAQQHAALSHLRELVGNPSLEVSRAAMVDHAWPALVEGAVLDEALVYSPQLQRLRFEASAAEAEAQIARASVYPQLSGQYSYSHAMGAQVGLALKLQTDGGFARVAAADAARLRVKSSALQVAAAERQLRDQLYSTSRDYDSATRRLRINASAVRSAQEVTDSFMRQFTSGRRTWLDVMNAVRESTSSEIDALEARVAAEASLVRLLLLSGRWAPAPPMEEKS